MASPTMTMRAVQSRDPSLSAEANELVTRELQRVVGHESVLVPTARHDHRSERHATHNAVTASAISVRPLVVLSAGPLILAGFIGWAGATGAGWVAIAALVVLMLASVVGIAEMVSRLFDEHEHMDPEVAARVQAEGVGDADRMFTDLVEEFSVRR